MAGTRRERRRPPPPPNKQKSGQTPASFLTYSLRATPPCTHAGLNSLPYPSFSLRKQNRTRKPLLAILRTLRRFPNCTVFLGSVPPRLPRLDQTPVTAGIALVVCDRFSTPTQAKVVSSSKQNQPMKPWHQHQHLPAPDPAPAAFAPPSSCCCLKPRHTRRQRLVDFRSNLSPLRSHQSQTSHGFANDPPLLPACRFQFFQGRCADFSITSANGYLSRL